MRLIDADALRDRLQNLGYDDWNQGVRTTWAEAFKECADMVEEMPTIEPERKKGKWIPQDFNKHSGMTSTAVYYYPKCSVCGNSANYTNFCPVCGADMRQGGDAQ